MTDLKSHPDLQLSEHIIQVKSAVNKISSWHSEGVVSLKLRKLIQKVVSLHDMGKATKAFQEYIANPPAYTGDPLGKAHTPMSTLLTLLLSKEEKWDPLDTMTMVATVFGHHRELPLAERLREIGSGVLPKTLKRQLKTLNVQELSKQCGIDILKLNLENRPWAKAQQYLDNFILQKFESLSLEEALAFRLKTQLVFSILLEADKAFLAVKKPQEYLQRVVKNWKSQWVEEKISSLDNTSIDNIRQSLRTELITKIEGIQEAGIFSLTAPTGSGKTLLSITWLLKLREKLSKISGRVCPKAIIVLPFLSVIDQTTKEFESLLTIGGEDVDGSWFLTSHSLSDRKYGKGLEEDTEYFFIDTWRTELIITTYDQFLMTLMDSKARYQMRFHNLCDSLIVMDEVQSIPCKLWKPLEEILKQLVKIGNSSILLMSATLPAIISDAKPLIENFTNYFESFNRYKLCFSLDKKIGINDFCKELFDRRERWLIENRRVLITLNTRRSALTIRDKLAENWPDKFPNIPLLFISADVTPKDRLSAIEIIKNRQPCIVVSTQCIEAGVDIDMDIVIRDFAPFDSLVQIAGRCNRNGNHSYPATVEIVDLINEQGKRYSDMIYDDVHLHVTRQLINEIKVIEENKILSLANSYFSMLTAKKDTGMKHLENFARWKENESVNEMLRGKDRKKHSFLVIEQDIGLKNDMRKANIIEDRWKRREAWRSIAGRIAKITIDIYAKQGFIPEDIATEYFGQWILKNGYYSSKRGLILDDSYDKGTVIF